MNKNLNYILTSSLIGIIIGAMLVYFCNDRQKSAPTAKLSSAVESVHADPRCPDTGRFLNLDKRNLLLTKDDITKNNLPSESIDNNEKKYHWLTPETAGEALRKPTAHLGEHATDQTSVITAHGTEYYTVTEYTVIPGESTTVYQPGTAGGRAVDSMPVNPYWSMGSNGLWQNPPVDPPSSIGRASYRHAL